MLINSKKIHSEMIKWYTGFSNKSNKETQAACVRKVVQIAALLEYLVYAHFVAC